MKHNQKLSTIALVLALVTILVLSGLGYVVLTQQGSRATTSVGTVSTVALTPTEQTVQVQPTPVEAQPLQEQSQQLFVATAPVLPAITVAGASQQQDLHELLGDGISLVTPEHTYVVSAGELGSWIDGVTWSDYMLHKKIRGIAREQDREAIPTKVIGNTDVVVEQGVAGLAIDQEAAYSLLVTALTSGLSERTLTIPTVVTQPTKVAVSSNAAPTITTGKQIVVVLSEQRLYAWNNGNLDASYLISAGLTLPTPIGDFAIQTRYENACMSGPDYHLCNIHWIQYFTVVGHSFHEAWWHDKFGQPMSHGCINMTYEASHWLWDWATYGTPVHIVE